MKNLLTVAALAGLVLMPTNAQAVSVIGTYYEDYAAINCSNSTICQVNFTQTPASQFLTIQNVDCHMISTSAITQLTFGALGSDGSPTGRFHFMPVPTRTISNSYYVDFGDPLVMKLSPTRLPYIYIDLIATSTINVQCAIQGTLSNS